MRSKVSNVPHVDGYVYVDKLTKRPLPIQSWNIASHPNRRRNIAEHNETLHVVDAQQPASADVQNSPAPILQGQESPLMTFVNMYRQIFALPNVRTVISIALRIVLFAWLFGQMLSFWRCVAVCIVGSLLIVVKSGVFVVDAPRIERVTFSAGSFAERARLEIKNFVVPFVASLVPTTNQVNVDLPINEDEQENLL